MDMGHGEFDEERANKPADEKSDTEKKFLKDLYNFMKKSDSPIERIPNLGFKQSNYTYDTFFHYSVFNI